MAHLLTRQKYVKRTNRRSVLPDDRFEHVVTVDNVGQKENHKVVYLQSDFAVINVTLDMQSFEFVNLSAMVVLFAMRKANVSMAMTGTEALKYWLQDSDLKWGKHDQRRREEVRSRAVENRQRRFYKGFDDGSR